MTESTEKVFSGQEFHTLKTYAYEKPGRYEGREPPRDKMGRDKNLKNFADDHNIQHERVRELLEDIYRAKCLGNSNNQKVQELLEELLRYAPPSADTSPPYDYGR